jgi:predicted nucleotidyltransferase
MESVEPESTGGNGPLLSAEADFLRWVVERAVRRLAVRRVWLFGSRARNDARPRSDFDLAFDVPASSVPAWAAFCAEVEEEAPTLHALDLVRFDLAGETMRQRILREGIALYENPRIA